MDKLARKSVDVPELTKAPVPEGTLEERLQAQQEEMRRQARIPRESR